MSSYGKRVKAHLSNYRQTRLGVFQDGISKGNNNPYPYILPEQLRSLNLIETYRDDIMEFVEKSGIRLHRDFHHLNSSQAACLNLFWPILNCADPNLIVKVLGLGPNEVLLWELEKVIDKSERTNFDLYIELESGAKIFIEFKLTEPELGRGQCNAQRLEKLKTIYEPVLREFVVPEYLEPTRFFANYQLLRNISFISSEKDDNVILVIPQGNRTIANKALRIINEAIQDPLVRSRVKILYHEELISNAMEHLNRGGHRIREHLYLYREKYLLGAYRD